MRENRRLEASGGQRKLRPFSGQIGRRKRCKRPGFCFIGAGNLSVVVQRLHTAGNGRSDDRGRIVGERT
jgi:hypothetical protein